MIHSIIICLFVFMSVSTNESNAEMKTLAASKKRSSITFILGEDEEDDQYYSLAKQYHLRNKAVATDHFIDTCRSLNAVRNVLEELSNDEIAWGKINIVVHSNQWTGMSTSIFEKGQRVTVDGLLTAMSDGHFLPLENEIVDSLTQMELKACGLGSNKELIEAISYAFGGFDALRPAVFSTDNFVQYKSNQHGEIISKELKPHYAFYRTAYKPADLHLKKQFEQKYPSTDIDWLSALSNIDMQIGEVYTTRFNVPIEWEVRLGELDGKYSFDSENEKLEFIRSQEDLMQLLTKFEIPIEKFRWNLKSSNKEGRTHVLIKGKATVVCVLKEI